MNKTKILPLGLIAAALMISSCTSYKKVPYMQNSDIINLDSSAVLYDARIMPKDELTITLNCPEDEEAVLPFNLVTQTRYLRSSSERNRVSNNNYSLQTYLVSNEGTINFPILGELKVMGMTTNELEDYITEKIYGTYLKTRPIVTVRMSNYKISVIGEVADPGTYTVTSEKVNIYEALALASDMTVWGRRDNVKLIREDENGKKSIHELDLNDADLINSPYFYMQQNDVLYVTPNRTKSKNSSIGSSTTYWVSATSILISVASLVVNICDD